MVNYAKNDKHFDEIVLQYYDPVLDHQASEPEVMIGTAGAAVTNMSLVEYQSDGKWDDADASSEGAQGKLGFALTSTTLADADTFYVVLKGLIRDVTWTFTIGGAVYASATAGEVTQTIPVVEGDTVRKIGYALDADAFWFDPRNISDLKIAAYQFTDVTGGSAAIQVTSPVGCRISSAGETAIAWGQIPADAQKVVRLKVWAVAKDAPAAAGGQMHCEFTFNAGASNAAYNTAATSWNVANKDSEEADYVSNDVVHWVLTDADTGDSEITALAAGDSFEILAVYESAVSPDGDTDAKFRVVEVEYV